MPTSKYPPTIESVQKWLNDHLAKDDLVSGNVPEFIPAERLEGMYSELPPNNWSEVNVDPLKVAVNSIERILDLEATLALERNAKMVLLCGEEDKENSPKYATEPDIKTLAQLGAYSGLNRPRIPEQIGQAFRA